MIEKQNKMLDIVIFTFKNILGCPEQTIKQHRHSECEIFSFIKIVDELKQSNV